MKLQVPPAADQPQPHDRSKPRAAAASRHAHCAALWHRRGRIPGHVTRPADHVSHGRQHQFDGLPGFGDRYSDAGHDVGHLDRRHRSFSECHGQPVGDLCRHAAHAPHAGRRRHCGGIWPILLALGVALATGAVCGLLNGVLIAYVEVPAILATLTTMTIYTGLAFGITKGTSISGFSDRCAVHRQRLSAGHSDADGHPDRMRRHRLVPVGAHYLWVQGVHGGVQPDGCRVLGRQQPAHYLDDAHLDWHCSRPPPVLWRWRAPTRPIRSMAFHTSL